MADRIDQDVLDAILAGATSIRRRIEIYEADATTLWLPIEDSARIISGNVNVDYTRSERRTFDLVLDNSDGLLDHDPDGFWYDKIIKTYRGINFRNTRLTPRIVVIAESGDFPAIPFLKKLGYTDITDRSLLTTSLENLYGFDLVVANYGDATPAGIQTELLGQAQYAGISVLTISSRATATQIPLIETSAAATVPWLFDPVSTVDTPFSHSFAQYSYALAGASPVIVTAVDAAARAAAVDPLGTVNFPALSMESASGVKWFHYQAVIPSAAPTQMARFVTAALEWLYTYAEERTFEVQTGEFLIDSIESAHFPSQVTINGRDYAKKLVNPGGAQFRNTVTFSTGTSLDTLTTGIAGNAGITKYLLSTNGAALTADITFERGSSRWDAIAKIHNDAGFEVFFNPQGYLVTRAYLDPTSSPTAVTLKTGSTDGNLASFNKKSTDSEVRNVVVVTGTNQDDLATGNIWIGVAENNEPSSPTRVEKLGPKEYFHETAFVKSNEEALALAKRILKVKALESYDLGFEALVFPWLEVGEIAKFEDPDPSKGEPTRYLLTSLTLPMGLGPMNGSGKRITIVGTADTLEQTLGVIETEEGTEV